MLNGKLYLVNSPSLIAAAMKNKDVSFHPFIMEFSTGVLNLTQSHLDRFAEPGVLDDFNAMHHKNMSGDSVYRMNAAALRDFASMLNRVRPGADLHVPHVYDWLQDTVAVATMKAMFGEKNPMTPEALDLIWCVVSPAAL